MVYCHGDVSYFLLEHVCVMCESVRVFLVAVVWLVHNQLHLLVEDCVCVWGGGGGGGGYMHVYCLVKYVVLV